MPRGPHRHLGRCGVIRPRALPPTPHHPHTPTPTPHLPPTSGCRRSRAPAASASAGRAAPARHGPQGRPADARRGGAGCRGRRCAPPALTSWVEFGCLVVFSEPGGRVGGGTCRGRGQWGAARCGQEQPLPGRTCHWQECRFQTAGSVSPHNNTLSLPPCLHDDEAPAVVRRHGLHTGWKAWLADGRAGATHRPKALTCIPCIGHCIRRSPGVAPG